ncbi:hypothetical protein M514_05403 [Trichuris suis]|uniref:Uncharacterized protein n=1 Tax=Trichuris suis TaxID=68888 RepID=A0A085NSG4_9BILA|nr:hypothetical protein M514_05403 [Trichuris suis]
MFVQHRRNLVAAFLTLTGIADLLISSCAASRHPEEQRPGFSWSVLKMPGMLSALFRSLRLYPSKLSFKLKEWKSVMQRFIDENWLTYGQRAKSRLRNRPAKLHGTKGYPAAEARSMLKARKSATVASCNANVTALHPLIVLFQLHLYSVYNVAQIEVEKHVSISFIAPTFQGVHDLSLSLSAVSRKESPQPHVQMLERISVNSLSNVIILLLDTRLDGL